MATDPRPGAARRFAKQLAQARHRRGLSVRAGAGVAGYSSSAVGQWETGDRTPSLTALEAWAEVLGYRLTLTPKDPTP